MKHIHIYHNQHSHHSHNTPPKLTWQWKIHHLKMYFLFKMEIFQPVMIVFRGVPIITTNKTRPCFFGKKSLVSLTVIPRSPWKPRFCGHHLLWREPPRRVPRVPLFLRWIRWSEQIEFKLPWGVWDDNQTQNHMGKKTTKTKKQTGDPNRSRFRKNEWMWKTHERVNGNWKGNRLRRPLTILIWLPNWMGKSKNGSTADETADQKSIGWSWNSSKVQNAWHLCSMLSMEFPWDSESVLWYIMNL